ncbi:uncharacterized protein LOC120107362 [Phoenix dactylifera]|uniref:Uncharacterized protein LOC120107362 n=1 Tax=Phoenix dactylifera TaxID=42345 RepID=A0A8B8ZQJ7_PHODC|nr:uncharacterized protein LOC120107362 [Phoenix dactylifera]
MTIAEYEAKFTELAKFVPKLVEDELDRTHKFEMGLKTEIRKQVVPYELTTYAAVVNKALIIEREVIDERLERERNQKKRNRSNEFQGQSNENVESSNKKSTSDNLKQMNINKCSRCGKAHADKDCHWNTGACFRCGKIGHKIADCPQRNENRSTQAMEGSQGPKTQGRVFALTQQDAQASDVLTTDSEN